MRYAVAVGSNLGDRAALIADAAVRLAADGLVAVERRSRLHSTAPVGGPTGQGDYLNGAWVVATGLGPHQLLHRLQAVESALGRVRCVPWGPRTIDLDLVLAEAPMVVRSGALTLPHPRLAERRFVLAPLAEIAAVWRHPLLGLSVDEMLSRLG